MIEPLPAVPPPSAAPVLLFGTGDAAAAFAVAASAGLPLTVVSPPGAGALWFRTLVETACRPWPGLTVTAVFDSGDRAGEAQGALAAGLRCVLFRGHAGAAERLSRIAAAHGATLLTELPPPLDLRGIRDPASVLTAWLRGSASAGR